MERDAKKRKEIDFSILIPWLIVFFLSLIFWKGIIKLFLF